MCCVSRNPWPKVDVISSAFMPPLAASPDARGRVVKPEKSGYFKALRQVGPQELTNDFFPVYAEFAQMGYKALGEVVSHALARGFQQVRQAKSVHLQDFPEMLPDGARQQERCNRL